MNVISPQFTTSEYIHKTGMVTVMDVLSPGKQLQLERANPALQFAQQPVVVSHSTHPQSQSSIGTVVTEKGGVTTCVATANQHQFATERGEGRTQN